jgi:hypothetical protein
MNSRLSALLAAGAAVALTLALSTPPTLATAIDSTFAVAPGGATAFALALSTKITLTDTKTHTVISCTSSSISAMLPGDGVPHAGSGFGEITAFSLAGCTVGSTVSFTVTPSDFAWSFNLVTFNTEKDVVQGSMTGMNFVLSNGAGGCSAVLDGTRAGGHNGYVKDSYSNKTKQLTISNTGALLVLYGVTVGCGTLFGNGDPVIAQGVYTADPDQNFT